MLNIAYTLAPRNKPTINKSIKSLRKAWFKQTLYIYAEPWQYDIEDKDVILEIHEEKKWAFVNYDYVLRTLKDKWDFLWIIQDDYVVRSWIKTAINKIMKDKEFWFYNMMLDWRNSTEIYKYGWNDKRIWRWTVWACFIFRNEVIDNILIHPFYTRHLYFYCLKKNQQIDSCIWETLKQMNLPTYFHSHSFVAHIWEESTLWHKDPHLWVFFFKKFE
jgi:hypothetical protein